MDNQVQSNAIYEAQQDNTQIDIETYSHVKKDQYSQSQDTKSIIKFYNTFPHLINELYTPNHWNPLMYAVRQLIEYLHGQGMKTDVKGIYNQVSIIHAAVYSGQESILRYVLNNVCKDPNPVNCETSPLKISMKTGNHQMVELLICKGAYYIFDDICGNLENKSGHSSEESSRYQTLNTPKKEVSSALVVEDSSIKDCAIKDTLRWARIKQAMVARYWAEILIEQEREENAKQGNKNNFVKEEDMSEENVPEKMEQEGNQSKKQTGQKQKQKGAQQALKITQAVEAGPSTSTPILSAAQRTYSDPKEILQSMQVQSAQPQNKFNSSHQFYSLAQILINDDYYNNILRALVGRGDSILIKKQTSDDKDNNKDGANNKQTTRQTAGNSSKQQLK